MMADCAASIGAESLQAEIEEATGVLVSAAWPLSLANQRMTDHSLAG